MPATDNLGQDEITEYAIRNTQYAIRNT